MSVTNFHTHRFTKDNPLKIINTKINTHDPKWHNHYTSYIKEIPIIGVRW